jgi:hypothetical protein
MITVTQLIRLIVLSFIGIVMSVLITLLLVFLFPHQIEDGIEPTFEQLNKSYTVEEMERHQKKMRDERRLRAEAFEKESFVDGLANFKKRSLVIIWVPWFFIGMFFRKLTFFDFVILITIPCLFSFFGVVWFGELPVFAGAILIGFLFRKGVIDRIMGGKPE